MAKSLKQKFLLKNLRMKSCKAIEKSEDYDFAPYDKQDFSSLQQMSLDIDTNENVSGNIIISDKSSFFHSNSLIEYIGNFRYLRPLRQ